MKLKDMIADLMTNDVAVRKSTWKVNEYIYYDRKARNFMLHLHNDNEEHANGIMLDYLTNEGIDWEYYTPLKTYTKDEVIHELAIGTVMKFYTKDSIGFNVHDSVCHICQLLEKYDTFYESNPT